MSYKKASILYEGSRPPLGARSVLLYRGVVGPFMSYTTMVQSKTTVQALRPLSTIFPRVQTPPPFHFSRAPKGGLDPPYSIEKSGVAHERR